MQVCGLRFQGEVQSVAGGAGDGELQLPAAVAAGAAVRFRPQGARGAVRFLAPEVGGEGGAADPGDGAAEGERRGWGRDGPDGVGRAEDLAHGGASLSRALAVPGRCRLARCSRDGTRCYGGPDGPSGTGRVGGGVARAGGDDAARAGAGGARARAGRAPAAHRRRRRAAGLRPARRCGGQHPGLRRTAAPADDRRPGGGLDRGLPVHGQVLLPLLAALRARLRHPDGAGGGPGAGLQRLLPAPLRDPVPVRRGPRRLPLRGGHPDPVRHPGDRAARLPGAVAGHRRPLGGGPARPGRRDEPVGGADFPGRSGRAAGGRAAGAGKRRLPHAALSGRHPRPDRAGAHPGGRPAAARLPQRPLHAPAGAVPGAPPGVRRHRGQSLPVPLPPALGPAAGAPPQRRLRQPDRRGGGRVGGPLAGGGRAGPGPPS